MMHLGGRLVGAVLLLLVGVAPAWAQDPQEPLAPPGGSTVVDRIVAIVGNQPILWSHVQEYIFQRQTEGLELPTDEAGTQALIKNAINELVDAELLVQQALRDTTIKVTDQEVANAVQQTIASIRGQFGSELEYQRELKKAGFQTPQEFRTYRMEQQRRTLLQNRLIENLRAQGKLEPVQPTEAEMRELFETNKAAAGKRPETISFQQIVVTPQPTPEAKEAARATADSLVRALRQGADFADAARRFSQDPGSAEQGGDLGWFRRGVMQPEFEKVAFAIRPGAISDPVETSFGYHVIRVDRTQPAEVQARHILIRPTVGDSEAAAAKQLADSIYAQLQAGAPFDSLQRYYHTKGDFEETPEVSIDQLTPPYSEQLATADSGQILPPFRLASPDGNPNYDKWAVVQVISRRSEGNLTFEDVRERIRQRLQEDLAVKRYIQRLRDKTYIDIREP